MDVSLTCMFSEKNYLYKFYDFFYRQHSLTNGPTYNDLFHIMQNDNIRNINNVIFTQWKHLEFRVNGFWCCLNVIGRYAFHSNKSRTHNHLVHERALNIWLNGWVFVYELSGYSWNLIKKIILTIFWRVAWNYLNNCLRNCMYIYIICLSLSLFLSLTISWNTV